jgi:hypothetical protein
MICLSWAPKSFLNLDPLIYTAMVPLYRKLHHWGEAVLVYLVGLVVLTSPSQVAHGTDASVLIS